MNRDVRVEAVLERLLTETPISRAPDQLRADIASTTSRKRQRPPWLTNLKEPPMRYRSQIVAGSPMLRLAAVVAVTAALTLALAGAVIAGASLLPSTSPAPPVAINPCTTPIVPVTGIIEWGQEVPGAQTFVSETGTHIRGWTFVSTMVMDDDRLDGTTTGTADHWDSSDAAGIARGVRRIENADGAWEGPETMITKLNESGVGLLPGDPAMFRDMWDLVGSGAYAGLSAVLFMDADDLRDGSDYPTLEGSIYPTDLASCEFAATQ